MDYHSIFLFQGLTEADIDQMERGRCLRRKAFARRQTIFHTGDTVHEIGIVLRGAVHIESIDLWGSKSILSEVGEGQAFAETYAFCGEPLMVDVLAAADCEVLFLDTAALSRPHAEHSWQDRLLRNLLRVSMKKNLALSRRILCTAPKTVRGRLLTYLSGQAVHAELPQTIYGAMKGEYRRAAWSSTFPSTASSWPTTSTLTAAPSPRSCAGCGTKGCSPSARTTSCSGSCRSCCECQTYRKTRRAASPLRETRSARLCYVRSYWPMSACS